MTEENKQEEYKSKVELLIEALELNKKLKEELAQAKEENKDLLILNASPLEYTKQVLREQTKEHSRFIEDWEDKMSKSNDMWRIGSEDLIWKLIEDFNKKFVEGE